MDNDTVRTVIAVLIPAFLGLVWLIRLEGRQDKHEAICAERYKNIETQIADTKLVMTAHHLEMKDVFNRLDAKLDLFGAGHR